MNKKIISVLSAAVLTLGAFATSNASVLVSDTFPYANGNLSGNTPAVGGTWAAYSSIGSHPIQVTNNAIVVDENAGAEDDEVPFAGGFTDAAGDVLYSSYSVNVAAPSSGTLTPVYFGIFLAGTSDFDSRVWVAAPATAGDGYRIALSQGSSSTAAGVVDSADLAFGTTYTIATSYDYTNKDGSLWLINSDGSNTLLGTTSDSGFNDAVTDYAFRQSLTAGNVIITVDNLQVGTTFADVVPEPASLSLLGAGAISLMSRRRK